MDKITRFFNKIEDFYIKHWWIIVASAALSLVLLFLGVNHPSLIWIQFILLLAVLPAIVFVIYLWFMAIIINPSLKLIKYFRKK